MRVRFWSFNSVFFCLYLFLTCITATSAVFAEEIRIDELIYAGIGEDRVGTSQTKPDGIPDARFYIGLEVPGSVEINEIRVFVADQNGGKGGEYWVSGGNGGWILGVYKDEQPLNPQPGMSLGNFSGKINLKLHGNDSGHLGGYSHFLVEVESAGKVVTSLAQLIANPHAIPATEHSVSSPAVEDPVADFAFLGLKDDKVSPEGSNPDGTPDVVFQLTLKAQENVSIREIGVFAASESGEKSGEYWVTRPGAGWFLGVVSGGKFVKTKFADDLGSFQGSEKLELRGTDSGRLGAHTHFLLEIAANGKTFSRLVPAR